MEKSPDGNKSEVLSLGAHSGAQRGLVAAILETKKRATRLRQQPDHLNWIGLIREINFALEDALSCALGTIHDEKLQKPRSDYFWNMYEEFEFQEERLGFSATKGNRRALEYLRKSRRYTYHAKRDRWDAVKKDLIAACLQGWEIVEHVVSLPGALIETGGGLYAIQYVVRETKDELLQIQLGKTTEPGVTDTLSAIKERMTAAQEDEAGAWIQAWQHIPEQTAQDALAAIFSRVSLDLVFMRNAVEKHPGFPTTFDIEQGNSAFTVKRRDMALRGGGVTTHRVRVSCHVKSKMLVVDKFGYSLDGKASTIDRSTPINVYEGREGEDFSLEIYGQLVSLAQVSKQVLAELLF